MMRNDKENIIVTKTFEFALQIIEFSENIFEQKNSHWLIRFLSQELPLAQMFVKRKMLKAKPILFIK